MTNKNYTKEQLKERYLNLPEELKEAMASDEFLDSIINVGNKYKLHIDQRGVLANEIGLVFLGVVDMEQLLTDIQEKLNISLDEAGEIVKDINTMIFFPIRKLLQQISEGDTTAKYQTEKVPMVENFSPIGNVSGANIIKPQSPLPNPTNSAIIINRKVDDDQEKKIFNEKMVGMFRAPVEDVEIAGKVQTEPKVTDPYHEPI